jgi:protein phosphatase
MEGINNDDCSISWWRGMSTLAAGHGKTLTIPRRSLVLLVGPSGSGKSTFAANHFLPLQVIESDHCRALVCDDPADQSATRAAFELVHFIAGRRLEFGKLTVIDATNVEAQARRGLTTLAREHNFPLVAIVFDVGEDAAIRQNNQRQGRQVSAEVVRRQCDELTSSRKALSREGFSRVYVLKSPEEAAAATVIID